MNLRETCFNEICDLIYESMNYLFHDYYKDFIEHIEDIYKNNKQNEIESLAEKFTKRDLFEHNDSNNKLIKLVISYKGLENFPYLKRKIFELYYLDMFDEVLHSSVYDTELNGQELFKDIYDGQHSVFLTKLVNTLIDNVKNDRDLLLLLSYVSFYGYRFSNKIPRKFDKYYKTGKDCIVLKDPQLSVKIRISTSDMGFNISIPIDKIN